jgi:hypothetical protein
VHRNPQVVAEAAARDSLYRRRARTPSSPATARRRHILSNAQILKVLALYTVDLAWASRRDCRCSLGPVPFRRTDRMRRCLFFWILQVCPDYLVSRLAVV